MSGFHFCVLCTYDVTQVPPPPFADPALTACHKQTPYVRPPVSEDLGGISQAVFSRGFHCAKPLTWFHDKHTQGLCGKDGESRRGVLDEHGGGHGVDVGLQRQLVVRLSALHLFTVGFFISFYNLY